MITEKLKIDDENEKELINKNKNVLETNLTSYDNEFTGFEKSLDNKFKENIEKNLHVSNNDSFVKDILNNEHTLNDRLHNFKKKLHLQTKNEEKENEEELKEEEMMNSFSNIPDTQHKSQDLHTESEKNYSDQNGCMDDCTKNATINAATSDSIVNPYNDIGCPTHEVFDKLNSVMLETKPTLHLRYENNQNNNSVNQTNHTNKSFLEITNEQAEILDKYTKDLNDKLKQDKKSKNK